ncbi:MAG: orange carotenoid protein N-terminal domain-containing protein [Calothrix sp. MO_192.B10]|nr:orange carotenoid protein N-terminal domain-containing protein [Calothrix sp. MO_192.B10]
MTFTTDSAQNRLFNAFNYTAQPSDVVASSIALFKSLSIDDQLAVLWYVYTEMGSFITPAATGAARLQLAAGLLNQIKQMSHAEQLETMGDLAANKNTQFSRSYGVFSPNTKLAFWYELAQLMEQGTVIPMPEGYKLSRDGNQVLKAIRDLEFSQQITVLRKAVVDMGVDVIG